LALKNMVRKVHHHGDNHHWENNMPKSAIHN